MKASRLQTFWQWYADCLHSIPDSSQFCERVFLHQENDFAIVHCSYLPWASRSSGVVELTSSGLLCLDVFAISLIDYFFQPNDDLHHLHWYLLVLHINSDKCQKTTSCQFNTWSQFQTFICLEVTREETHLNIKLPVNQLSPENWGTLHKMAEIPKW